MFVPISAFLRGLVFEVSRGEEVAHFVLLLCLDGFLQVFPQLIFFQKSKGAHHPRTRRHLCAKCAILRPSQL